MQDDLYAQWLTKRNVFTMISRNDYIVESGYYALYPQCGKTLPGFLDFLDASESSTVGKAMRGVKAHHKESRQAFWWCWSYHPGRNVIFNLCQKCFRWFRILPVGKSLDKGHNITYRL